MYTGTDFLSRLKLGMQKIFLGKFFLSGAA